MESRVAYKKKLTPLLYPLLLGLALPVWGQPQDTEPTIEQLLVMDLNHSKNVDVDVARTLTDLVTANFSEQEDFRTLSGEDIRKLLEIEGDKQALGCEEGESCLAEIAGAMGARFVIYGRISKLDTMLILQLNLFDAQAGVPISRKVLQAESLVKFTEMIPTAVESLSAAIINLLHGNMEGAPLAQEPEEAAVQPTQPAPGAGEPALGGETSLAGNSAEVPSATNPVAEDSPADASEGMGIMTFVPWGVAGVGVIGGLSGIGVAVGSVVAANMYLNSLKPLEAAKEQRGTIEISMYAGLAGGVGIMLVGVGASVGGAGWGLMAGDE
jgi:hypothetical protein